MQFNENKYILLENVKIIYLVWNHIMHLLVRDSHCINCSENYFIKSKLHNQVYIYDGKVCEFLSVKYWKLYHDIMNI